MSNLKIVQGDITQAQVDAIVNAANPQMLGGGGVDGAIHQAAGPELLEACERVPEVDGIRCPPGEARMTRAGLLPAKYVIHTVGPVYDTDPSPAETLTSAYISSLKLAMEQRCRSIAFPAISCGAYGYPVDEAALVAFNACSRIDFSGLEIHFYLYNEQMARVWRAVLNEKFPSV